MWTKMKTQVSKFFRDEEGAGAIEYALIAGLMAAVLIAAFLVLGDGISDGFDVIVEAVTGGTGG